MLDRLSKPSENAKRWTAAKVIVLKINKKKCSFYDDYFFNGFVPRKTVFTTLKPYISRLRTENLT